jgi:hypothetical protein
MHCRPNFVTSAFFSGAPGVLGSKRRAGFGVDNLASTAPDVVEQRRIVSIDPGELQREIVGRRCGDCIDLWAQSAFERAQHARHEIGDG